MINKITLRCKSCNNVFYSYAANKQYCNFSCYNIGRLGTKRNSAQGIKTRQKLLGVKHTAQRNKNKSEAQKIKFAPEILQAIIEDMKVPYYTEHMICSRYSLSSRVYNRLKMEHVPEKLAYIIPRNLTFEDLQNISKYSKYGLSYKEIAILINRKNKLTRRLIKLLESFDSDKFIFISKVSKLNRKETWPEKMVRNWLTENNTSFLQECQLEKNSKWYFDFKLNDMPLVIEVHGDYWHCNPYIYPDGPKTEWHKYSKRRDYQKRDYAVQMGYKRIVIWENSIKTKPQETKDKLLRTIEKMDNQKTIKTLFEELGYDISKMEINKSYGVKNKNYGVLSYNHEKQENCWSRVTNIIRKKSTDGFNVLGPNKVSLLLASAQHKMFVKLLEDSVPRYETLSNLEKVPNFYAFHKNKEWVKCTCINTKKEIDILDCEIEGTHCYYSNGILSHNTMFGDPLTTPGGNAIPYACSTRLRITSTGQSKIADSKGNIIGIKVKAKTIKNKVAKPFRECEFQILFGQGIREHEEVFDLFREYCSSSKEKGIIMSNGHKVVIEGMGAWKNFLVYDKVGEVVEDVKFNKSAFGEKVLYKPEYSKYMEALFEATLIMKSPTAENITYVGPDLDSAEEAMELIRNDEEEKRQVLNG